MAASSDRMFIFAVTSVSSLLCHASTCFRIGSKLRCMRSTPTEMQSISEKDFECLASTSVNAPGTMFPYSGPANITFPTNQGPGEPGSPCSTSGLPVSRPEGERARSHPRRPALQSHVIKNIKRYSTSSLTNSLSKGRETFKAGHIPAGPLSLVQSSYSFV